MKGRGRTGIGRRKEQEGGRRRGKRNKKSKKKKKKKRRKRRKRRKRTKVKWDWGTGKWKKKVKQCKWAKESGKGDVGKGKGDQVREN